VPLLATEDLLELSLHRRLRLDRLGSARPRWRVAAQLADRVGVRAFLLAQVAQQRVGGGIPGCLLVEDVDGVVLGRLGGGEQAVDRGDPRLRAPPQRHPHALRRRHLDPELAHPPLQPIAVTGLGLRHAPQDLRFARGHPQRDQLVQSTGVDLLAPGVQQVLDNRHSRTTGL
jgi:hypothetical protein